MFVDVVELRKHGVKLSSEALRHKTPVHGDLLMYLSCMDHVARQIEPHQMALLNSYRGGHRTPVLPCLSKARVRVHSERADFLVLGAQHVGGAEYPQAWWCRPVGPTDKKEREPLCSTQASCPPPDECGTAAAG